MTRLKAGLLFASATILAPLLGGGSAYASWTAEPQPLVGAAAADAGAACRTFSGAEDGGEDLVVAERRGEWTFVLLAGEEAEAVCLMPGEHMGKEASERKDAFGAYSPGGSPAPPLEAATMVPGSAMSSNTSEGWFTWATGYVGRDVTGVTVHTSSGLDVEASLTGNRFAAWWPEDGASWSYTVHLADGSSRPQR